MSNINPVELVVLVDENNNEIGTSKPHLNSNP